MKDKVDIIMRENSRCFGCKKKIHEKQMLEKYPNLYKGESCYICKADLRCLHRIHRINFEWYCDKCYKKYKEN